MTRGALACIAIVMAAVALNVGLTQSWAHAWLLALTFATGIMFGLLLALAILWDDNGASEPTKDRT